MGVGVVCVCLCVCVWVCVCSVCLQMFRSVQMPRAMLRSVLNSLHRCAEQCTTAQISVCGCVSVCLCLCPCLSVCVCGCLGACLCVCVSVCVLCVLCVCVACVCVCWVCVLCVWANQTRKVFAAPLKRTRKSHASEQSSSTWTDKSARRSLGIYNAITQQTGQRHWAAPQGSTTGQH